ncbi:hypothetical protein ES708_21837 [subsurface metagenome]
MRRQKTIPRKSQSPHQHLNDSEPKHSCQENSSLVKDNILENADWRVYANCVVYTPHKELTKKSHIRKNNRGSIRKFSKKSRFRLFSTLAKIKTDLPVKPIFVSLTYHHGHRLIIDDKKTHLHHFLVRLRLYDPYVQFIWRMELQKRGAPHFHLIIFPGLLPEHFYKSDYKRIISLLWHEIADPHSMVHKEYGCKSITINSYREACIYLSKYVAKLPESEDDKPIGKHWGCSRNLPFCIVGTIHANRKGCQNIVNILRNWLIKNGRAAVANPDYFNIDRPQIILISSEEFA